MEKILKSGGMRVLVVSQYFWPEVFRINELVAELVRRGHDVTVLTGLPNYPEGKVFTDFLTSPSSFSCYKGAKVVRVPLLPRGNGALRLVLNYLSFVITASILGPLKLRGRSFDVILGVGLSPVLVGIPSAVLRRLKRAPQAFWILDLWPETLKAVGVVRSQRVLAMVGKVVKWIYRRCDLLLVQSRTFTQQVAHYASPRTSIEYFPAWADDVFTQQETMVPASEVEMAPDVFTVLFAGNIGEAQDFPAVLKAAECLKDRSDIRWVIVGDGRMAEWVRNQLVQRGLSERVILVGRYPLERMPEFFAHADALLVSLKDDPIFAMTIPGKLQAYLGSGLPVLAMLNGEGARIVTEARAGLVCAAGDWATLAEQVGRLASMSAEERQAMGQRGRRLCELEFHRVRLADRLENWLRNLAYDGRRSL